MPEFLLSDTPRYIGSFYLDDLPLANELPRDCQAHVKDFGINGSRWISDGTYWVPDNSRSIIALQSATEISSIVNTALTPANDVAGGVWANGNEQVVHAFKMPGKLARPTMMIRSTVAWSVTGTVGTKTLRTHFGATKVDAGSRVVGVNTGSVIGAVTMTNTAAGSYISAYVQNAGSMSAQVGGIGHARNMSAVSFPNTTSAIVTSGDSYLYTSLEKATFADAMSIKNIMIEVS